MAGRSVLTVGTWATSSAGLAHRSPLGEVVDHLRTASTIQPEWSASW